MNDLARRIIKLFEMILADNIWKQCNEKIGTTKTLMIEEGGAEYQPHIASLSKVRELLSSAYSAREEAKKLLFMMARDIREM